jgi:acyl-CoA synthetase (AMP-forming)/AMP-acid ligase II
VATSTSAAASEQVPAGVTTWSSLVAGANRDNPLAVVGHERRWSGAELLARAAALARWVESLDVPPGTPLPGLFGATVGEVLAATIAGAATQRPLAPLGPRLTVHELLPVVKNLATPVVLADSSTIGLATEVADGTGARAVVLPELAPLDEPLPAPPPTATAFYLHTSGTTGLPKPVALRQDRLLARARVNGAMLGLTRESVYATLSPYHHIAGGGNVVVAMGNGAAVAETGRFTPDVWTGLAALGTTHALLVPSMIETLLAEGVLDATALQVLQYGGAPIHADTLRRVLDVLPRTDLVNMFGQTEGSPITCLVPEDHRRAVREPHLLRSVGRAAPGVELRFDGVDPETGVGEVLARGAHLMRVDDEGWLHTGDLGKLDDDGFLFLSGRQADKIVRGGENVFPVEVEDVLVTHPAVAEAGVVGVPDRRLGETVAAFVVPADPAAPPDFAELRAYTRERLSGYKVPAVWHLVEALPRNAAGKVLRRLLMAEQGA